ncbi:unnamed protein product, partial [Amoebophrya sp. A25]
RCRGPGGCHPLRLGGRMERPGPRNHIGNGLQKSRKQGPHGSQPACPTEEASKDDAGAQEPHREDSR